MIPVKANVMEAQATAHLASLVGLSWEPLALAAKGDDPENNPTWEQAMNGPLKEGYMEACRKEIETLKAMDVWEVVDRETCRAVSTAHPTKFTHKQTRRNTAVSLRRNSNERPCTDRAGSGGW